MRVGGAQLQLGGQLLKILSCPSTWRSAQARSFTRFMRRASLAIDSPGPGAVKGFALVPAASEHRALVAECLRASFFKDEPLMQSLGLDGGASRAFEDYVLKCLGEGLSFMAVGRSPDEVLGVCLNATIQHNEPMAPTEFLKRVGRRGRTLMEFDEFCFRESNLFRRYFVSHLFEVRYLAVSPKMRGNGVAKALTQRSLQLAKDLQYPMAVMNCKSQFGSNLAKSLEMTEAWSLSYDNYNPKSKPRLRPPSPHSHVRMMVTNLA